LYDEANTYWNLEAEGREQRRCLSEKFHQCTQAQVNENEFKTQLAKTTWFKDATMRNSPYLILDTNETIFISIDQAFMNVAIALNWNEVKKAKIVKKGIIRDLCFRCVSTNVDSREFTNILIESKFFGEAVPVGFVPPRREPPHFLGLDLFLNHNPSRIAWPQVCKLYLDFHKYSKRELDLDELFAGLQSREYKKLSKKQRAKTDGIRENQIALMPVPFEIFIRAFTKHICPLDLKNPENSDPFWTTTIGAEWRLQGDNASTKDQEDTQTIDWKTVYQGFSAICPLVAPLDQIDETAEATSLDTPTPVTTEIASAPALKTERVVESIKKHYAAIMAKKQDKHSIDFVATTPAEQQLYISKNVQQENSTIPKKDFQMAILPYSTHNFIYPVAPVIQTSMAPQQPHHGFLSKAEKPPHFQLRTPYSKTYSNVKKS